MTSPAYSQVAPLPPNEPVEPMEVEAQREEINLLYDQANQIMDDLPFIETEGSQPFVFRTRLPAAILVLEPETDILSVTRDIARGQ